jgi:hypothetical protein
MRIKLVKRYSTYHAGKVVECEDETARRLIADGVAVSEEPAPAPAIETAAVEHQTEVAAATPRRTRRSAVPKPESRDAAGS